MSCKIAHRVNYDEYPITLRYCTAILSACTVHSTVHRAPHKQSNNYLICIIHLTKFTLTGIGPVCNLRFSPSFSYIKWKRPLTAGVPLSSIYYRVIVINMNIKTVIINTTTSYNNTKYMLGQTKFCVSYTAIVIPLATNHRGDSVNTTRRTFGGELLITVGIVATQKWRMYKWCCHEYL